MSTLKSSEQDLTLNADGSGNDIKFQSNGSEVASIDQAGVLTAGGATLTGNIAHAGALTIDVGTYLYLDSDGAYIYLQDDGTSVGLFKLTSSDFYIKSVVSDKDLIFQGKDGASGITALTLDMSDAGVAKFNRGILFNNDTAAANELDDYEEGTWTASLVGTTTGSLGNATGVYTKIGNVVYFGWYSESAVLSSSTGSASITGLPFTVGTPKTSFTFHYVHGNAVDGDSTGGNIWTGGTSMYFYDQSSVVPATFVDGTVYITVSGWYMVG